MLPKTVNTVIEREIKSNQDTGIFYLSRRKGDHEEQLEDTYTGIQLARRFANRDETKGSAYDILPDGPDRDGLTKSWMEFHAHFPFPDFAAFYSKKSFCMTFSRPEFDITRSLFNGEDHFISLLADRRFLFLEDNEHGNNPDYPPLSGIVRNPDFYLTTRQLSGESSASQVAITTMRENARVILEQGFVPTRAHQWAYNEMKRNEADIRNALEERKALLQNSQYNGGIVQFPTFEIQITGSEETSIDIDMELSQLFHDFLYAAAHRAYVRKYKELLGAAKENSLNAIICVRQYLEEHPDLPVSKALIYWWLFTKETAKLAKGELENFKFKIPKVKTSRRLTRETQAPTYRKIDCQIMLFDYLLKLLPPENEQEIACAKFQFHALSKYNGYAHFRVKDVEYLKNDTGNDCKFDFSLIPDSKDGVDYLGGVIRKHILRCISNDVRWLTPGLPNNWNINSSILATLLLQDTTRFPKSRRLVNRIHAILKDKGKKWIQIYRSFEGEESELIAQLEKWCIDNDLIFEDDIPSSDMEISDDKMKLLCSRLVLEYMLKERALVEVRECLSTVAEKLWGDLLLKDCETFCLAENI